MAEPRRVPERLTPEEPWLLETFQVKNIWARVVERMTADGPQPYTELMQAMKRPDGTERTQNFACRMDRFQEVADRSREAIRERSRARDQAYARATPEQPQHVRSFRVGQIQASVMVGATKSEIFPYVELTHTLKRPDGAERTQNFTCRLDRFEKLLSRAQEVLRERARERGRDREQVPKQWHTLVKMTELTREGGKVEVVRSYDDLGEALAYKAKHTELALYTRPFSEEPERGAVLDVRRGERADLDRQIRQLEFKNEQGKHFGFGIWFDKGSRPEPGQPVNFTSGQDYRGEPEERRVTPLRAWDPGSPQTTRYVVYEMSSRTPGLARVVGETRVRADALLKAKELDVRRIEREKVLDTREWEKQDLSPKLRQVVDLELER